MRAESENNLVITAASEEFGPACLALLGSLNLNWGPRTPILVYDLGLDAYTLRCLKENDIQVRKVPPFCPHWRDHFTWKIWCLNDAPAANVLWLDAGLTVLQPLDEIWAALNSQGYFFTTNYELLDWEASLEACNGCGVSAKFRNGKLTLAGTMMGFRKTGNTLNVLVEALAVALVERNIAATEVTHRHDQAIISLLAYKYLGSVLLADGSVYLGALSPKQIPSQKVWLHRRKILESDVKHLTAHIKTPGDPFVPSPPYPINRAKSLSRLYRVYWYFGQGKLAEARDNLKMVFEIDSTLKGELPLLATILRRYQKRLQGFLKNRGEELEFLDWTVEELKSINGFLFALRLSFILNLHGQTYRRISRSR